MHFDEDEHACRAVRVECELDAVDLVKAVEYLPTKQGGEGANGCHRLILPPVLGGVQDAAPEIDDELGFAEMRYGLGNVEGELLQLRVMPCPYLCAICHLAALSIGDLARTNVLTLCINFTILSINQPPRKLDFKLNKLYNTDDLCQLQSQGALPSNQRRNLDDPVLETQSRECKELRLALRAQGIHECAESLFGNRQYRRVASLTNPIRSNTLRIRTTRGDHMKWEDEAGHGLREGLRAAVNFFTTVVPFLAIAGYSKTDAAVDAFRRKRTEKAAQV